MVTPKIDVGDVVWVCAGQAKHEDLATVVRLNVPCSEQDEDDSSNFESEEKKEKDVDVVAATTSTGILVRFDNRIETVVPLQKVRSMNSGGRNSRRSARNVHVPIIKKEEDDVSVLVKPLAGEKKSTKKVKKSVVMDVVKVEDGPYLEDNGDDDDEDDNVILSEMKSSSKKKKITTAASKRKRKTSSILSSDEPRKLDPEEIAELKAAKKRKRTTSKAKGNGGKKMDTPTSPYFDENDTASTKTNAVGNKKKAAVKKKKPKKLDIMITEESVTKRPGKIKRRAGQSDGHGGLNQGAKFSVEYATSARATCKRCDIRINKNELRVGHRPLFRGKPGYKIFKHLQCIVFSEDVMCVEDIAGHEDLNDEDYKLVAKRVHESVKEIEKENEDLDPDELVQKGFQGEIRPSPKGLGADLMPFQKEGVSWMYCQETKVEDIRGGILADEMGMGKTLQTITTILDNKPRLQHAEPGGKYPPSSADERKLMDVEEKLWDESLKEWKHEMVMNDVHKSIMPKEGKKGQAGGGARAGTLVVCPLIALSQWKSEIEKFCNPSDAVSVCVYHGPDRSKNTPRELLIKYDIVLTTYQVLQADHRKMISPNRVKCPNCGARFKIDKLHVHLKYFCGEGAQRTEAQARTMRNSERGGNASRSARGGNSSSNNDGTHGKKNGKKKFADESQTKKKTFKVKSTAEYASESDLSVDNTVQEQKKSPRNAAAKANSRLRQTKSKVSYKDGESDEDFSLESDDEGSDSDYPNAEGAGDMSDESSDDERVKRAKVKQQKALARAKAMQAKALAAANSGKKKFFPKENENRKKVSKAKQKAATKKGVKKFMIKGKKVFEKDGGDGGDGDDSDDSGSSGDESEANEPDIDMEKLVKEAMAGAQMSILHSVCWWRIVLDEAHMIKSRSSQTSAAAFTLTGIHRWCLSGTPLQNRVGEFYSLIRFLRIDPMAHYMCRAKGCGCKQIHYRMMNGKCRDCGHSSIQHYSHFNKHILNPIQRDGYSHDGRRAMFTLKNEVLDKCLLRRTKLTKAEDLNLPPRIVNIKTVRLHPVEEDFYNALYTQTTSSFNDYVEGGTLLNNYAHIFDLLMRMRQSVAHPYLVIHSKKGISQDGTTPTVTNGRTDCDLCHEPPTDRVISTCCRTGFCKSCVIEYMETAVNGNNGIPCPHCREPFSINLNEVHIDDILVDNKNAVSTEGVPSLKDLPNVATGSILRRIDLTNFATSTKIEALTQELIEMRKTSPGSKAIVFSQFINMLDLIRWRLHSDAFLSDQGLGFVALHGSMDVKARDAALDEFRENPNVRVLLMSLKAGGVALNLTVANHVYLMDPWWNPAAELQAIDRTHRLGQYRPIRAVRFIAENTVEERILQLQEKKRLVFDGTVGRDAGSLKMLTVDDMKSLFA